MKPELRFSDYNDEWICTNIKSISNYIDGNYGENYPKEHEFIEIGVPFITSAVIGTSGIFDRKLVKYISEEKNSILTKAQSKGGDIILTNRGASMGVTSMIPNDYVMINIGPQLTRIRCFEDKVNPNFLLQLLKSPQYLYKLRLMNAGSAMPFISLDGLGKFKIAIPSLEEQKVIGNLLTLFDKKIELQLKKIENLKLLKKEINNILIDEIKECKMIPLRELGTTYSGLSGKSKEDFENGNCRFINFMGVLKDFINVNELPSVKIDDNENQNKVKKGDLFFNTSSETKEEVALCSTINDDIPNLYLNSFCFGYRINDLSTINNEYLNLLLHSSEYRKQISNLGQGFTRVNISKNVLLDISVKVPNMENQSFVVNINNKIRDKILLEENYLLKLKNIKKGLMQKMFV